ncbi:biotin transporter BioY [Clostridium thermarum]|uniref:biotin transporter BioY n=1 Tax=Clostridium thermarum TaxID=1716543 RepID=UPI0013D1A821|nr:biotin transporter BioY [Clostridium thermarum]
MKLNLKMMILTSMFTVLTAVGAFIKIPFGAFLPDITLQIFFVALGAVLLGKYYGALAQVLYIFIGLAGFPIFTQGGGIGYFVQPSFGYLIGFIPAAFVVGYISEKFSRKTISVLFICSMAGVLVDYLIGVPYLYFIMSKVLDKSVNIVGLTKTGFLVFLPGDILKCIVAAILGAKIIPALKLASK